MTRVLLLSISALALLSGCVPEEALCAELLDSLRRCDLQAQDLRCGALSFQEKTSLLDDVDEFGCDGLRDEDGMVRPEACEFFGWDCPRLSTDEGQWTPQSPVLYVGGIDASPAFDWRRGLLGRVQSTGVATHHVSLPPWASVEDRTLALAQEVSRISSASPTGRVHLVCWAVGGLDCRYLVSPGGLLRDEPEARAEMERAVVSITTLGTPHRGTYVATAALVAANSPGVDDELTKLLGWNQDSLRFVDPSLVFDLEGVRAQLHRLEPSEMERFNRDVIDAPGIYYQSFAGVTYALGQPYTPDPRTVAEDCSASSWPLFDFDPNRRDAMSELLLAAFGHASQHYAGDGETRPAASDGMIPVPSARWGSFRGCLPADHYDLVGQFKDLGPDPSSGFDVHSFHLALVSDLADLEAQ